MTQSARSNPSLKNRLDFSSRDIDPFARMMRMYVRVSHRALYSRKESNLI